MSQDPQNPRNKAGKAYLWVKTIPCAPFSAPTHQHRVGAMAFPEEKQARNEKGKE